MILNRNILAIFLVLTSFLSYSQGDKARLDSVYKLKSIILANNIVASQGVGYAGMPSRHWYSFSFLLSLSTNDELLEMTHDSSPAVRLYAYIGLVHNKYTYIETVKRRLLSDTAYLSSIEGCTIEETTVAKGVTTIENWYLEKSTSSFLTSLRNDQNYRSQLYGDIINKRQIGRPIIK